MVMDKLPPVTVRTFSGIRLSDIRPLGDHINQITRRKVPRKANRVTGSGKFIGDHIQTGARPGQTIIVSERKRK